MYEKLTPSAFKKALTDGKYLSATAARRAVGKASTLSESEKDSCRKIIDNHFGDAPAKKAPAKKAVVKKVAVKKAPAKKSLAKKAAPKGRSPKGVSEDRSIFGPQPEVGGVGVFDDYSTMTDQIRIAEKTIQNTGMALTTLIEASKVCPDTKLQPAIESAGLVLAGAVTIFRSVTSRVAQRIADDEAKQKAESSVEEPPEESA